MDKEITVTEMKKLPPDSFILIDIRDEYAFGYGHIDGAKIYLRKALKEKFPIFRKTKS